MLSLFKISMNETINTKLSYWCCDNCCRNLKHGEFRFNCTVCDNYDLCEKCFITVNPTHPHQMIRELAYGKEEDIEENHNISMADAIQIATIMYRDRFCFGVRDRDTKNPSLYADTYSWLTFDTIGIRSKNFGQGLRNFVEPRGYVGICAENRPEWMITDFACVFHGIISVPMYRLLNDYELTYIINNTQISVVVCSRQMLSKFIQLHRQCPCLRHIVCMDPTTETILGNYLSRRTRAKDIPLSSYDFEYDVG